MFSGEIYTAGKSCTLPEAVQAVTNITSVLRWLNLNFCRRSNKKAAYNISIKFEYLFEGSHVRAESSCPSWAALEHCQPTWSCHQPPDNK